MRMGVVAFLNPSGGGLHQYSLSLLDALDAVDVAAGDRKILFVPKDQDPGGSEPRQAGWERVSLPDVAPLPRHVPDPDRIRPNPEIRNLFLRHEIDWLLLTAPHWVGFEAGIPYVMPVHDLQHRLQPEFPELTADGELERREYLFRNGCRCALRILADSEVGKEDILRFYGPCGVERDQIAVIPYLPPPYLPTHVPPEERRRVREAYRLPDHYLFYPAQFWPHKNHLRLVQALAKSSARGIHLVLCGSCSGPLREQVHREVFAQAEALGVRDRVLDLGYVPDLDMAPLYVESRGLAMPTFFGPTNIPILEGWKLSCPVLTSDIHGLREWAGDATLLVDPRSVEALAEGMLRLWRDEDLRRRLIAEGLRRSETYTSRDFQGRVRTLVKEAAHLCARS